MGRNWDFFLLPEMLEYSLVMVYRPKGKRPFIAIGFPGGVATTCLSTAINSDGLAIGANEIPETGDGSPKYDSKNTPTAVLARRILEECRTLDEAHKLLQANKPCSRVAFVACDRNRGGVFEMTPKTVVLRRGEQGICFGTNHFRSKPLTVGMKCWRADKLAQSLQMKQLGVADVAKKMHQVNQRHFPAHSVVFELNSLTARLAFGDGKKSATAFALKKIDLKKLLKP